MKRTILIAICLLCMAGVVRAEEKNATYFYRQGYEACQKDYEVRENAPLNFALTDEKDTLNKLFSLVSDLHIKQMGIDRYEQIVFPETYYKKKYGKSHD